MASRRDMSTGDRRSGDSGDGDGDAPVPARRRRDPNAGARGGKPGAGGPQGDRTGGRTGDRTGARGTGRGGPTRLRGPLGEDVARSDRPLQVAGEIRRSVQAEIGRGLNDPRVQGLVSVTEVEVLPDFSEARVKVSVLPEQKASLTLSGLRAAAGFLRRRVMDETRIGRVPRLVFELDERFKRESALDAAIRAASAVAPARSASPDAAAEVGDEEEQTR